MKTPQEIKERISAYKEEKKALHPAYIKSIDTEQQDFYAAEIVRYDFMILELEWILK